MTFEQIDMIDAPVSDTSAGIAAGIGIGLGIVALMFVS